MDIKQLHLFLHVCAAQSMRDAAYAAAISQPALSRQIRLLEHELGVQLFERHARGVTKTDAGKRLEREAKALVSEAARIKAAVSADSEIPQGQVRVGTPSSLRRALIAPAVADVVGKHPRVSVHIQEGTSRSIRDELLEGGIDVAVISDLEELSPFHHTKLASEPLFLVAAPGQLAAGGTARVQDLVDTPLILTPSPNSLRIVVDRALAALSLRPQVLAEIESFEMALELILLRLGRSVFPFSAVQRAVELGWVDALPIDGMSITWIAATVRGKPPGAATQALHTALTAQAQRRVSHPNLPFDRAM